MCDVPYPLGQLSSLLTCVTVHFIARQRHQMYVKHKLLSQHILVAFHVFLPLTAYTLNVYSSQPLCCRIFFKRLNQLTWLTEMLQRL